MKRKDESSIYICNTMPPLRSCLDGSEFLNIPDVVHSILPECSSPASDYIFY